jgi:hypothetical protein
MGEFIFSFNSAVIVGSMFNCHLFISAAKNTFGTRSVYKGKPKIVKGDKPWFNLDCEFARQNYRKLKSSLNSISDYLVDFPVFKIFQYSFG